MPTWSPGLTKVIGLRQRRVYANATYIRLRTNIRERFRVPVWYARDRRSHYGSRPDEAAMGMSVKHMSIEPSLLYQISQGCAFVCELRRVPRESKGLMLLSKMDADSASPYFALSELGNCYQTCNNLTAPRDKLDRDWGPCGAYLEAHTPWWAPWVRNARPVVGDGRLKALKRLYASAFDPRNWALYWLGYVLWDESRISDLPFSARPWDVRQKT